MSPEYPREIELERLLNVSGAFGWELVREEVIGEDLHVTVKKAILKPGEVPAEGRPPG